MGQFDVSRSHSAENQREFMRTLLADVHALERMLEEGLFETGIRRIGFEQEMFLVDSSYEPAPIAVEVLEKLNDPDLVHELALFNLEANLPPFELGGTCLSRVEDLLRKKIEAAHAVAQSFGAHIALTGILPTLDLSHLGLENMTPNPRYHALNEAILKLRGGEVTAYIKGVDELNIRHDNVMLEACNTSFQVHFQVDPDEFADLYNLAQVVTAPVLAAAVNSPIMMKSRLWKETRVALFQQSVDARSATHKTRGQRTRVSFGERWVDQSILEIMREDIARYRVLLEHDIDERPNEALDRGEVPALTAMRMHCGTVWRWNRGCYGVHEGVAHLRIENRVLPAGPTIIDEIANAAFYFGLMIGVGDRYGDVRDHISFDEAKANFTACARYGLQARLQWLDGRSYPAENLILEDLLPMARAGLESRKIDGGDIDRYLGVIEERVRSGRTGARWALDSLQAMGTTGTKDQRYRSLAASSMSQQQKGAPVHEWSLATLQVHSTAWRDSYRTISQMMTTDLFTVRPEDSVDLTASLMDWEHVRHVPVEDDDGRLVGIVSHRRLLRLLARGKTAPVAVREIMHSNPISVTPKTSTLAALNLMRDQGVACLPVVEGDRLVGIVTASDFMDVAYELLREHLRD